jgi:ubiquinone/menaquinone biosynthesis C-methylase UbiE
MSLQKLEVPQNFWDEYYLPILISRQRRTRKEVDLIVESLDLPKNSRILDLACGTGRHSIELARRGYSVVGLDSSQVYIDYAKKRAERLRVKVEFVLGDMRKLNFKQEFDAVINVHTSFGYYYKKDFDILRRINNALKTSGKFFIDVFNKDAILKNLKRKISTPTSYGRIVQVNKFDPRNSMLKTLWKIYDQKKKRQIVRKTSLRVYNYNELKQLVEKAGFSMIKSYGSWNKQPISMVSPRLILVCQKY